jgi:chromosome segregation ATPase
MDRCSGRIEVPTEKEREALAKLKSIKESVRALKQRLKTLQAGGGQTDSREILGLERELALLKGKWERWEEKREEAQEERMVLLGHR